MTLHPWWTAAALVGAVATTAVITQAVTQPSAGAATTSLAPAGDTSPNVKYRVRGSNARLNRKVLGTVTDDVQGVPASPVHSFVYDGDGSTPIEGSIRINVDPITNTGAINARWEDENGSWRLHWDFFAHPHHASGLVVAPDSEETDLIILDSIATNCYLHGNTTAGLPVVPTVFAYMAAWGPCDVWLNGEQFDNPYDGTFLPQWEAHLMVTQGIRAPDGTVRAQNGDIYNPMMHAEEGYADLSDLEIHLTWHDGRYPEDTSNFPVLFDFFYHVLFEDVTMRIGHFEEEGEQ